MDIKQIRYFHAVAQYGSIAEAARHSFIVQPALSRQIKELESFLGIQLFIRHHHGIELTSAGKQFLKDTSHILTSLNHAITNVRRSVGFEELHIGIAPSYTWHPWILDMIRAFHQKHPTITLNLEPALSVTQNERIGENILDGGIMAWRPKADHTKHGITLMDCKLLIACAKDSKVSLLPLHTLDELKDEQCIFFPREASPEFHDFVMMQLHKAGFSPALQPIAYDFNSSLGFIAAGVGYTIISSASRYNKPENIVLREHPDISQTYALEFVYKKRTNKKALLYFVDFIKNYKGPKEEDIIS